MSKHGFDEHQMNIEFETWYDSNTKFFDAVGVTSSTGHYEAIKLAFISGWQLSYDWHQHGVGSD